MNVDLINRNVRTFMELLRVANRELFIYNGTRETINRFETTTEEIGERFLVTSPEGFFNGSVINKYKPVFNGTTLELSLLRKYENKTPYVSEGFSIVAYNSDDRNRHHFSIILKRMFPAEGGDDILKPYPVREYSLVITFDDILPGYDEETLRQLVEGFSDITEKYALWMKDYRFGTSTKLVGVNEEAYQKDCNEYKRLLRNVFKGLKIVEKS